MRGVVVKCDIDGGVLYTCVVTWCVVVLCGGVRRDDVDVRFRGVMCSAEVWL